MLVRSWNLFHGNTLPVGRRAYLREMVELATLDRPDVLCLQEVPGWALRRLGGWTGMTEVPVATKRPAVGPLPVPAALGRLLTAPHHGLIRSAFAGQGNALLLAPGLKVFATGTLRLNPSVQRKEPRLAQRVELELPGGGGAVVVNVHCTNVETEADVELALALAWALDGAGNALVVVAGDFNIVPERSSALRAVARLFSVPILGSLDQVLVGGAPSVTRVWAPEERAYGERLLSDHAPVEARF
jgi:endonuclease/exonuclease/phosphatase family metal-dependent hydrolase